MQELLCIPQDSLVSLCLKLLSLSGGRRVRGRGYEAIAPDASFFYARYILNSRCDEAVIDAILADAEENELPGLVSFCDALVGANWGEALVAKGFTLLAEQAGMLMDLADYEERPSPENIVRIGADRLKEWSRVCETAFPKPTEMPALRHWIQAEDCEFYAYLVDDVIVGTLLGYAEGGNYGLHEVATLPDYRRRGICEALVHHAAAAAKRAGNRYVSLQGSASGEGVYARCGLSTVCRISTYFLPKPQPGM